MAAATAAAMAGGIMAATERARDAGGGRQSPGVVLDPDELGRKAHPRKTGRKAHPCENVRWRIARNVAGRARRRGFVGHR
jgi:hypothetical protein